MTGCFYPFPYVQYKLTISSTAGGSVTMPGEGTFTYTDRTVVYLMAEAEEDYHFVKWTDDAGTIADVSDAITTITMNGDYSISANFKANFMIGAGRYHTVGLKANGTVVAVGSNGSGQGNVSGWTGMVQVAGGGNHTVGLKANGTVVVVGSNSSGQCNVGNWTDITQVTAGVDHTVGLKSDGTVVAVGSNGSGQCNVGGWTGIAQVAAGSNHTVGLKANGTVIAVGWNNKGQCDVDGWDLN